MVLDALPGDVADKAVLAVRGIVPVHVVRAPFLHHPSPVVVVVGGGEVLPAAVQQVGARAGEQPGGIRVSLAVAVLGGIGQAAFRLVVQQFQEVVVVVVVHREQFGLRLVVEVLGIPGVPLLVFMSLSGEFLHHQPAAEVAGKLAEGRAVHDFGGIGQPPEAVVLVRGPLAARPLVGVLRQH